MTEAAKRHALYAGLLAGAWAAAALMAPVSTPLVAATALLAPMVAGALVAIRASEGAGGELDVDESVSIGSRAGFWGGLVVALPVPLFLHLYTFHQGGLSAAPRWARGSGLTVAILSGLALFVAFEVLAVIAAVVAGRLSGSQRT